jgi:hypothetical protein
MKGDLKAPFGCGQESLARFDKHKIAEYRSKTRAAAFLIFRPLSEALDAECENPADTTEIVIDRTENLATTTGRRTGNRQQKRSGRNRTDLPHSRLSSSASTSVVKGRQRLRQLRATDAFQRSPAMPMTVI